MPTLSSGLRSNVGHVNALGERPGNEVPVVLRERRDPKGFQLCLVFFLFCSSKLF